MSCPHCQAENDPGSEVCFTCGRGLNVVTLGALIAGRYEVQALLGRGGMGAVYKAHDRVLDETVALKVLRPDFASNESLQLRFLQEIKLARKISHRNVCRIHEYGDDHGLRYISMAYVDGIDLRKLLQERGPLPMEEAYDAMVQVAEGLAAIHDEGIVHRDLKTPNLVRDAKGVVRLLDFGIAKEWQAPTEQGLTATGALIGTPEYLSPEQILGRKSDLRADIYALGIVTFEVFTGQLPFRGETPAAIFQRHVSQPPPLQGPEAARLPRPLLPVLRRALAKEPQLRYENAIAMAEGLSEAWTASRASARDQDAINTVVPSRGGPTAPTASASRPTAPGAPPTGPEARPPADSRPHTPITDPARHARPATAAATARRAPIVAPPEAPDEPNRAWMLWVGLAAAAILVVLFALRSRHPPMETQAASTATESPTPAPTAVRRERTEPTREPTGEPSKGWGSTDTSRSSEPTAAPEVQRKEPPPPVEAPRDAVSALREGCDRGTWDDCLKLGETFRRGDGVPVDTARAAQLFERACDRGLGTACEALGTMYLRGQGVRQDPARATSLLKQACSGGGDSACRLLEDMARREPGGEGWRRPPPGGGGGPPPR
jgi:serine/threonine protein kinase